MRPGRYLISLTVIVLLSTGCDGNFTVTGHNSSKDGGAGPTEQPEESAEENGGDAPVTVPDPLSPKAEDKTDPPGKDDPVAPPAAFDLTTTVPAVTHGRSISVAWQTSSGSEKYSVGLASDPACETMTATAETTELTHTFTDVPSGRYAVCVFALGATGIKTKAGAADDLMKVFYSPIIVPKSASLVWNEKLQRWAAFGAFTDTIDLTPDADGGTLTSAGDTDLFVAWFDEFGAFDSAFSFGGPGTEGAVALMPEGISVSTGDMYLLGSFQGSVDFNFQAGEDIRTTADTDSFALKINADKSYGGVLVFKGTGGLNPMKVLAGKDGKLHLLGNLDGTEDLDPDAGTVSVSTAGYTDILYARYTTALAYDGHIKLGSSLSDDVYQAGLALTADNSILIMANFKNTIDFDPGAGTVSLSAAGNNKTEVFVASYSTSLEYQWVSKFNGGAYDYGNVFGLDAAGNIYVAGHFASAPLDLDPGAGTADLNTAGGMDIFVTKLSPAGEYIWGKSAGTAGADLGWGGLVTSDGKVYVHGSFAGQIDFDPGAAEVLRTPADTSENYLWSLNTSGEYIDVKTSSAASFNAPALKDSMVWMQVGYSAAMDFSPFGINVSHDGAGVTHRAVFPVFSN